VQPPLVEGEPCAAEPARSEVERVAVERGGLELDGDDVRPARAGEPGRADRVGEPTASEVRRSAEIVDRRAAGPFANLRRDRLADLIDPGEVVDGVGGLGLQVPQLGAQRRGAFLCEHRRTLPMDRRGTGYSTLR
jgi:hypothetical protein